MISLVLLGACADIRMHLEVGASAVTPIEGGEPMAFGDTGTPASDTANDTTVRSEDTAPPPVDTANVLDEAVLRYSWSGRQATRLRSVSHGIAGQLLLMEVTGDSKADLIHLGASAAGIQELSIWPGLTTGLGPPTTVRLDDPYLQVIGGDFTGDGLADLLASTGAALHLLVGNGSGFATPALLDEDHPFNLLGAVDVTGDGRLEAIVSTADSAVAIRVYGTDNQDAMALFGTVNLGTGELSPASATSFTATGVPHTVAVLAEARFDTTSTRYLAWDPSRKSPILRELDVVRNGGPGVQSLAAYGEDMDEDGEPELVTTGATGLFVWNPARSAVREVRAGDPARDVVTALARADLDGDGAQDALEMLVHAVDATHYELHLQPSLARQGTLEASAPVVLDVAPGQPGWLGALVAGNLDDDDCADAVVLGASFEPWLVRGLCLPEAP